MYRQRDQTMKTTNDLRQYDKPWLACCLLVVYLLSICSPEPNRFPETDRFKPTTTRSVATRRANDSWSGPRFWDHIGVARLRGKIPSRRTRSKRKFLERPQNIVCCQLFCCVRCLPNVAIPAVALVFFSSFNSHSVEHDDIIQMRFKSLKVPLALFFSLHYFDNVCSICERRDCSSTGCCCQQDFPYAGRLK